MKLTPYQAEHLYQLAYEHFQEKCHDCQTLKARMEKHLGKEAVSHSKKIIKLNGYCK